MQFTPHAMREFRESLVELRCKLRGIATLTTEKRIKCLLISLRLKSREDQEGWPAICRRLDPRNYDDTPIEGNLGAFVHTTEWFVGRNEYSSWPVLAHPNPVIRVQKRWVSVNNGIDIAVGIYSRNDRFSKDGKGVYSKREDLGKRYLRQHGLLDDKPTQPAIQAGEGQTMTAFLDKLKEKMGNLSASDFLKESKSDISEKTLTRYLAGSSMPNARTHAAVAVLLGMTVDEVKALIAGDRAAKPKKSNRTKSSVKSKVASKAKSKATVKVTTKGVAVRVTKRLTPAITVGVGTLSEQFDAAKIIGEALAKIPAAKRKGILDMVSALVD